MADLLSKMTLARWIVLFVVLAVIAFVLLTQFTSFQVPKALTGGKRTVTEDDYKTNPQGSTHAPTNLDAVKEILDDRASGAGASANEEGASSE